MEYDRIFPSTQILLNSQIASFDKRALDNWSVYLLQGGMLSHPVVTAGSVGRVRKGAQSFPVTVSRTKGTSPNFSKWWAGIALPTKIPPKKVATKAAGQSAFFIVNYATSITLGWASH
jgi:hypothetical protein